jgi:hypothetical protein
MELDELWHFLQKKQERQNRLSVEGVRRKSSKGGWRCPGVGVV